MIRRAFLVAQREYMENIRTKGFWIGIMMMPIMLMLIGIVPYLASTTREPQRYVVIDHSDWLLDAIEQKIDQDNFRHYLDAPVSETLHTPLDKFKKTIADSTDDEKNTIVKALLGYSDNRPAPLTSDQQAYINKNKQEIQRWWMNLADEQRAQLSSAISTNRFVLEDAKGRDSASLNAAVQDGSLFAYFVIGAEPIKNQQGFRFVSNNLTDRELLSWFSDHATRQVRLSRLKQENIDIETASWINLPVAFEDRQINDKGDEESVDSTDIVRQWTPVVFVYLLWLSVLINTQMLLTNTIEEKSNKLIEVLLSSISPLVLMAGKIIGIALTGLTIIGSWVLMALAFFLLVPKLVGVDFPIDITSVVTDPWFLGSFFIYFLLGYLLYAAILVGIGSVCNNLKEAQNLMLPVQLVQMLPILLMVPIGRDPNGTLAVVLSYIPPLTPFVMMNRAAAPPTTSEYIVTTLLLVASVVLALWFAAKIFRIGILLTGKPPGFWQIMRWLRAPVIDHNRKQPDPVAS